MANLRKWSSSASGNSSVAGGANTINFAEGQTPGSVNNSAREMMAQVRSIYTPAEWGWVEHSATASVASQTAFKISGNQTTNWTAGRRWRLKSGSTTRYGSVVSSSFTAETTITVTVDSGSLSASHSLAALSPIDVTANQIPAIRFDSSGNVGIGIAPTTQRLQVSSSLTGTTPFSNVVLRVQSEATGRDVGIQLSDNVTYAGHIGMVGGALYFGVGGAEACRIDASKNFLMNSTGALGYGTGSGGTVTQITSKATGVTLNKTNGRIITTADALAGGTAVQFSMTNSTVAATDTVLIQLASGDANTGLNYQVWVGNISAGSFVITLLNRSGGSRSEALTLNFSIIKAVTS